MLNFIISTKRELLAFVFFCFFFSAILNIKLVALAHEINFGEMSQMLKKISNADIMNLSNNVNHLTLWLIIMKAVVMEQHLFLIPCTM